MHILILNIEYPPIGGGASPVTKKIALKYRNQGHEVFVLTTHFNGLPDYEEENGISIKRLKCNRLRIDHSRVFEHILYLWKGRAFLQKLLEEKKFDICHCHFLLPTGLLAMWLQKYFQIPFITTIHGSDIPGYNPDRFKNLHQFTPRVIRRIASHCQLIISPSSYLQELAEKVIPPELCPIRVIPNGIESKQYLPGKKDPIILSTGRLVKRKGFHHLVEALAPVESKFSLHICGDGPMMPVLENLAKDSKTPVIFHGWLENDSSEYRQLLAKASIYSLVSSNENASIALLEAMASGCAIVTANSSGCALTIGEAGVQIEAENIIELRKTLVHLMHTPKLVEKYGLMARKKVETDYEWDVLTDIYLEILENFHRK